MWLSSHFQHIAVCIKLAMMLHIVNVDVNVYLGSTKEGNFSLNYQTAPKSEDTWYTSNQGPTLRCTVNV